MLGLGLSNTSLQAIADNPPKPAVTNAYSLGFDGTNDYLDTSYTANTLFQDSFTVSAWIKPRDGQKADMGILGVETGALMTAGSSIFRYYITASGGVMLWHSVGVKLSAGSSQAIQFVDGANNYAHVAIVVQKVTSGITQYYVYVNGSRIDMNFIGNDLLWVTDTEHAAFDSGGLEVSIGALNDDGVRGKFYDGILDEVSIFEAALNSRTVAELYNLGNPSDLTSDSDLLMYYRFEDNTTPTTAVDTAGNHNGTPEGATFNTTLP